MDCPKCADECGIKIARRRFRQTAFGLNFLKADFKQNSVFVDNLQFL